MTARAPSRQRRRTQASVVVIYWRDIPAQVTAQAGEHAAKVVLPARFQKAIDKAAHVAGLTDRHDYIAQWRRDATSLDELEHDAGSLECLVQATARRLDAHYDREALAELVRNGGATRKGRP